MDRGYHMVSVTDPHSRVLGFLDRINTYHAGDKNIGERIAQPFLLDLYNANI
jgi:hypothetical protein